MQRSAQALHGPTAPAAPTPRRNSPAAAVAAPAPACGLPHRIKQLQPVLAALRSLAPADHPVHHNMCVVPLHGKGSERVSRQHSVAHSSAAAVLPACGKPPGVPPIGRHGERLRLQRSQRLVAAYSLPTIELVATKICLPLCRSISSSGTNPGSSWMYLQYQKYKALPSRTFSCKHRHAADRASWRPADPLQPRPAQPLAPMPHFSGFAATSRLMLPSLWHRSTAPRTSLHRATQRHRTVVSRPLRR